MTGPMSHVSDGSIQAELDRLTYSAYLLTLDPAVALSVVAAAVDGSLEDLNTNPDLARRTVELSLEQLRRESAPQWDRESSAFEVVLYGDYQVAYSDRILPFKEDASSKPILSLDSSTRIAFVLHHVLGYKVKKAAAMAQMSEKEFRGHLRNAYVQLALSQLGPEVGASVVFGGGAQA
jgi:DNA-directed RNA polymerase specialized sigma24 family protein